MSFVKQMWREFINILAKFAPASESHSQSKSDSRSNNYVQPVFNVKIYNGKDEKPSQNIQTDSILEEEKPSRSVRDASALEITLAAQFDDESNWDVYTTEPKKNV